jgi:dimethylhistidine N-methyltransferase
VSKTAIAAFHDLEPVEESFREAVLAGLAAKPKAISSKFIYDARGSELFEAVTRVEAYYPTRVEMALLRAHGAEIGALAGAAATVVEFGAGASDKARVLLSALERPALYVAVDISRQALLTTCGELAEAHPALAVVAVCADFTKPFALPDLGPRDGGRRLGFFPGTTIGNLRPAETHAFLAMCAEMLKGGGLLIGADLRKDSARIEAAYNDAQGVNARFNLNLMARINRELGGDLDLESFRHHAVYNRALGRMDIGIRSTRRQSATVLGRTVHFGAGEILRTQVAYKYTVEGFQTLSRRAGLEPERVWQDDEGLFSVHYLRAP